MPIKVPNDLPAIDTLTEENVFVMTDTRAITQDVRPLKILLLNLMPTKIETETQLTRLLGNTPLQIELELMTVSRKSTHVSEEHMINFYKTFDQIKDNYYDGFVFVVGDMKRFLVDDTFPRLVRKDVPASVANCIYDLLLRDLEKFEKAVDSLGRSFTQNQFDALVSFTYNCGAGNLNKLVTFPSFLLGLSCIFA